MTRAQVLSQHGGSQFSDFKRALTDVAVARLGPINAEMARLMADPAEIDRVLDDGAERAGAISEGVMRDVRRIVGFA